MVGGSEAGDSSGSSVTPAFRTTTQTNGQIYIYTHTHMAEKTFCLPSQCIRMIIIMHLLSLEGVFGHPTFAVQPKLAEIRCEVKTFSCWFYSQLHNPIRSFLSNTEGWASHNNNCFPSDPSTSHFNGSETVGKLYGWWIHLLLYSLHLSSC